MQDLLYPTLKVFKKHKLLIFFYFILFILLLSIALVLPFSFDDAVFMKTARNLATYGIYSYAFPFDPIVTTGFPVIIPVSILYLIYPFNLLAGRIVPVLYFLLFVTVINILAQKLGFTKKESIIISLLTILICLFTIPNFIITSLGVYGEIPALAFFLLSIICFLLFLKEKSVRLIFLCGLFAGLSFSTKYIMLFVLPSILLVFIFASFKADKKKLIVFVTTLLLGMTIPELFFRLYHLTTVGYERFFEDIKNSFIYYQNLNNLSNLEASSGNIITDHLLSLREFGIRAYAPAAFFFFTGISLINAFKKKKYAFLVMLIFAILMYSRWLFFTHNTLLRHLLPGMVVFNFILATFFVDAGGRILTRRRKNLLLLFISLTIITVSQSSITIFLRYNIKINVYEKMSKDQYTIANFINSQDNAVFYHLPWYSAPEYSLLSGKTFQQYLPSTKLDKNKNNFLILTPKALTKRECYPDKIAFYSYKFLICKLHNVSGT